jgi:hypothetical protein
LVSPFDKKLVSPRSPAPPSTFPSRLAATEALPTRTRRANEKSAGSRSEQRFFIFAMVRLDCTGPFAPQIESPGSSKDSNANDSFPVTRTDSDAAASCCFAGKNECVSRTVPATAQTPKRNRLARTNAKTHTSSLTFVRSDQRRILTNHKLATRVSAVDACRVARPAPVLKGIAFVYCFFAADLSLEIESSTSSLSW